MKTYRVTGNSMASTFADGDIVLGLCSQPLTGSIIAFDNPHTGRVSIKRLVKLTEVGMIVVHGDGTDSLDSRLYGPLPKSCIRHVTVARMWPWPKLMKERTPAGWDAR